MKVVTILSFNFVVVVTIGYVAASPFAHFGKKHDVLQKKSRFFKSLLSSKKEKLGLAPRSNDNGENLEEENFISRRLSDTPEEYEQGAKTSKLLHDRRIHEKLDAASSAVHGERGVSKNAIDNMADRFLQSDTVGVVDSIASHAILGISRFVDGASVVMVNVIDSLPTTIDRVATAVDGIVTTADNIGRVVVPHHKLNGNRSHETKFVITSDLHSESEKSLLNEHHEKNSINTSDFSRRRNFRDMIASGRLRLRRIGSFRRNRNKTTNGLQRASKNGDNHHHQGGIFSSHIAAASENHPVFSNQGTGTERSPILKGLSHIMNRNNFLQRTMNGSRGADGEDKRQTIFEKNFDNSKTQQSINKLEDQFSIFLGRLLGSIYRNADPIDQSISGGIRRVLRVTTPKPKEGEVTTLPPTSTTEGVKFRLSFDDI